MRKPALILALLLIAVALTAQSTYTPPTFTPLFPQSDVDNSIAMMVQAA